MSLLIRDGAVVADDARTLADDEALPSSGRVIVSLERWTREQTPLQTAALQVGVRIPNTTDVLTLDDAVLKQALIALEFPAFGDGRAYSQAHLLRQRRQYRGEIRATGAAVVRDQIAGMARCGINAFALRADQDAQACLQAFKDFSLGYQPATDGQPLIFRRRA